MSYTVRKLGNFPYACLCWLVGTKVKSFCNNIGKNFPKSNKHSSITFFWEFIPLGKFSQHFLGENPKLLYNLRYHDYGKNSPHIFCSVI